MIEADTLQSGQRRALHARRPCQEPTVRCTVPDSADDPPPQGRRNAIRLQAAETGDARPDQTRKPVQPPFRQRLGDFGLRRALHRRRPAGAALARDSATHRNCRWRTNAPRADGCRHRLRTCRSQGPARCADLFGCLVRDARDAGIGRPVPAQCRMQGLMVGGDEDVAARARSEWRRDTHGIKPHRAAACEVTRPLGQMAGDQRMQMIDLWGHASRGSGWSGRRLLLRFERFGITKPYAFCGNPATITAGFAVPPIHLAGSHGNSQLSVRLQRTPAVSVHAAIIRRP